MSLIQGSDGSLYGTTQNGGANGTGTVFQITPTGTLNTLYSFCMQTNCDDGAAPYGGLVQGTDGNFYGTTYNGGVNGGAGTVFKITPTGTLNTLYSFCMQSGCTDGVNPYAGLVQATDGNLYGTTQQGGDFNGGTVFKITPTGALTTLYSFCMQSGCADGVNPTAGLVHARDGNFYGTTEYGGSTTGGCGSGCGTVFKISAAGMLTTLYTFCVQSGCPDGAYPLAGLVQGTDGNFYGTTYNGGTTGNGTVFEITSTGVLTNLYSFSGPDGANPQAELVQGTDGNFYGTTGDGGIQGIGTVFKITPTRMLTTLYSFCAQDGCTDGEYPHGGLLQASDGSLYGTTYAGGTGSDGTVFRLSLATLAVSVTGSGTVTSTDGFINCPGTCTHLYPTNAPVTLNATPASGWTFAGWTGACSGTGPCNVVMTQSLSVTATFSQTTYLLTVSTNGSGTVTSTDGDINCPSTCGNSYPTNASVTLNATPAQGWSFAGWSGACSGTGSCNVTMTHDQAVAATFTQIPGNFNLTVSISGSGLVTSTDGLINCPGACSNTYPNNAHVTLNATPTQGATFSGYSGACSGTGSCTVTMTQNLSVTATFSGAQQEMMMHSFGIGNDGQAPVASLISDSAGNLYGTAPNGGMFGMGTVFEVSPNGSETILHSFGNGNDGQGPLGSLVYDSAGNLYGTTSAGGAYGDGTVFELSSNGTETVLYSFAGGADGQNPGAGLIFDSSGNLYGTTLNGGAYGGGTAFELSPNGAGGWIEAVVYSFGNGSDGLNPAANLIFDSAGNLYGTTSKGGMFGKGTAFELGPNAAPNRCCREIQTYSFGNGEDGANPYAGLLRDSSGNLYGTTVNGGTASGGTAFELSPGGGGWTEAVVYSFGSSGSSDGLNPSSTLVLDNSGNLYGTTANGGLYSGGTIFELLPENANPSRCCREVQQHSFGIGTDGKNPYAGLIFGASGTLYGTTINGGISGLGTVFGIMLGQVQFLPATPCRVVDTRNPNGPFGGPPISGDTVRSFPLASSGNPCNIPPNVIAYSLNVTVVPQHSLGYLTIWPTGQAQPLVSTLNSPDGRTKANAAIVPAGSASGSVSVYVTDTSNVILDINGYFVASSASTLAFYPLPPCRLVDTRGTNGPLGGPRLPAQQQRDFPLLMSSCIPAGVSPAAYSLNFTAVPNPSHQHLGYLTVWPTGQTQPLASTLNNPTGTTVANAAIVPAGSNGEIAVYGSNTTDLLVDINGYFATPGQGGYSFYPVTPCRAYDSRNNNGQPFSGERMVNIVNSPCAPPNNAAGYVFNATVVPNHRLGYLTLWPDGEGQPVVSTLNAYDGFVTSNMAIVPTIDGITDGYAGDGSTQLILDLSGYFAP